MEEVMKVVGVLLIGFMVGVFVGYRSKRQDISIEWRWKMWRALRNTRCELYDRDNESFDGRTLICDTHGIGQEYISGDFVDKEIP